MPRASSNLKLCTSWS